MEKIEDNFAPLRKGLLELAVLSVISGRKAYAADILERLANTPFATSEGTLYPLFSKLKRENLVAYDWVESGTGPPRKYYMLTSEGKTRLVALRKYWIELEESIDSLGGIS